MEKGQLRCDANVSVRLRGEDRLGTRTELKNINSFRFVQNAVEHEIARQMRIVDGGGRIERETRLWDADAGQSAPMRIEGGGERLSLLPRPRSAAARRRRPDDGRRSCSTLPELPVARFERYQNEHGLAADDARTLVSDRALADYFDAAVAAHPGKSSGRTLANWMLTELLGALNADGKDDRAVADDRRRRCRRWSCSSRTARSAARSARRSSTESYQHRRGSARDRRAPRRAADLRRGAAVGDRRPGRRRRTRSRPRATPPARTACSASSSARS